MPDAVAVDPRRDTVYAANSAPGTISVINGRTDKVTATIRVGDGPMGIAVDVSTKTAYVSNTQSDSVSVLALCGAR